MLEHCGGGNNDCLICSNIVAWDSLLVLPVFPLLYFCLCVCGIPRWVLYLLHSHIIFLVSSFGKSRMQYGNDHILECYYLLEGGYIHSNDVSGVYYSSPPAPCSSVDVLI